MPGAFNPNFNPAQVMLGSGIQPGWGGNPPVSKGPYMPTKPMPPAKGGPLKPATTPMPPARGGPLRGGDNPPPVIGPTTGGAVRATGTGPYDAAYRQDLATYAGGNMARPAGGVLSFDPTGALFGSPTGGGTAPVQGMPTDLLSMALGGQAFGAPQAKPKPSPVAPFDWQKFMRQFGGNMFGGRNG